MSDPHSENPLPRAGRALPRSLAAFESIQFRWLIGSLLSFFLAMQAQFLVRSLLAWQLTGREMSLAYINLVVALPMVVGSFIAGAVIDRVERRRLIVVAQIAIMVNELLVLLLLLANVLEFWHVLVSSFILGVLFPFVMPTRTAMIYGVVGRDKLGNAMALQAATMNVARILGPSLAGVVIATINIEAAYVMSVFLFLISTFAMFRLPQSYPEQRSGKSLFGDVSYSFTYVAKHRDILLVILFGFLPMMLALPVISMLVVFAEQVFEVGESGLGILMAMVGLGGVTGSFLVAHIGDTRHRTFTMVAAAALFGILLALFSISTSFVLSLGLLLLANMFSNVSQTLNNTLVQILAHNEVRGRMSSFTMLSFGLTPLGVLPIAFAAEQYGIASTIFAGCLILLGIVLAMYVFSPTLRRLDRKLMAMQKADEIPLPDEKILP
jgi:predicted MFS family arabinose efflux permease